MAREDLTRDFGEQDQAAIEAAERDLAALLAVEPSPEFRVRVRTRIDAAPEPRGWWKWSWALTTATALLLVATGAAVLLRTTDARREVSTAAAGQTKPDAGSEVRPKPDSSDVINRAAQSAGPPESATPARVQHITPAPRAARDRVITEVVVDGAQVEAIRRLLAAAARAPRDAAEHLPPGPEEAAAIDIAPALMVVQPLTVPGLEITSKGVER